MPQTRARGRVLKRTASQSEINTSNQEETSDTDEDVEFIQRQPKEAEVREPQSETAISSPSTVRVDPRTTTTTTSRRPPSKRQKVKSSTRVESEFVEIEYVDQLRENFSPRNGLAGDLPPIHDLSDIFKQIATDTAKQNGFKELFTALNGRPLRVATVCSGTESPILALEMIAQHFEKPLSVSKPTPKSAQFTFKHVFSAEIVEYKQAYIERNFRPPLLFRDVIELHRESAHTAYGAKKKVPDRIDLLVAGFPCVDYSNLNNWRKKFGERGESNDTLRGLVAYCEVHRPRIVILENITNAPWQSIGRAFEKIDYHFRHVKVDTKDFYLPQTRERGYALCILRSTVEDCDSMLSNWVQLFSDYERRASSPFTAFLDADDDVIEQRKQEQQRSIEPRSSPVWSLYKIRHADVRRATTFGYGRPITHWEEGGTCCPPTWMDRPWFSSQVERVWDTIDVNHLRTLSLNGYDNTYKVRCVDVSQGVDRDMDNRPLGIMGCITPCGMLYSTARGGQIQGHELLAMQGLPVSRLSLTRETQSQMQDLAGNAMSTTVVGPAIMAALLACSSVLKLDDDEQCTADLYENPEEQPPTVSLMSSYLTHMKPIHSQSTAISVSTLQKLAGLTSSLCTCEGPYGVGRYGLYWCSDCRFTACAACKVNPVHNYQPIPISQLKARQNPKDFREKLIMNLPYFIRTPRMALDRKMPEFLSIGQAETISKKYFDIVERLWENSLCFKSIKRRHIWTVLYEGQNSTLQLIIEPRKVYWELFAKAPENEPARSYLRETLRHPVARMEISDSVPYFLKGRLSIFGPLSRKDKSVTLRGVGPLVPSYANMCGLPNATNEMVWSTILVEVSDQTVNELSLDIRGHYERIPDCGGALRSMHRRLSNASQPDMFFFLDPRGLGPSQLDSWVFSTDPRRNVDDNFHRDIILQLDCKWNYQQLISAGTVTVLASCRPIVDAWDTCLLNDDEHPQAPKRYMVRSPINLRFDDKSCYNSYLPLLLGSTSVVKNTFTEKGWTILEEATNSRFTRKFDWLWAKFSTCPPCTDWNAVATGVEVCRRCSPKQPRMAWAILKGRERPIEDPADAARCEMDYKLRPNPFCLFEKVDKASGGWKEVQVCLALNVKTMLHRACGAMVNRHDHDAKVEFYWRMSDNDDSDIPIPGSYRVLNNNQEPGTDQPPNFIIPLREDQLRSLRWALSRESIDSDPFPEEEVEEATLSPLNWRAEAKVIVQRKVRGGILADHVGFGKTAVILGLIDRLHENDAYEAQEACKNAIPVKATCIVVPDILFDQWRSEIVRFLGETYSILEIENNLTLAAFSIKDFQNADIVLVSWTVLTGTLYFKSLEEVAGGPCPPKTTSSVRMFEAWFQDVLGSIENQVEVLKSKGSEAFLEAIHRKKSSVWGTDAYNRYIPSKKLAGKKGGSLHTETDALAALKAIENLTEVRSHTSPNEVPESESGQLQKKIPQSRKAKDSDLSHYRTIFGIHKRRQSAIEDVKGTVFHMYRFQRLVVDEFTYLNQDRHALLASFKARSRWILSGTPAIKGFAATERMARLLDVYLGKVCDEDYDKSKYKRSESENFHFFREIPSRGWHFRRNGLAQHFCDVFMRQNAPDIPPIKWTDHYVSTLLSAVERISYLELKLFYESYNPQTRGEKRERYVHDQRGRISEIVDSCETPEQGLIKRSSYYNTLPSWSSAGQKIDTVQKLMNHRCQESTNISGEMAVQAKAISWLYHQVGQTDIRLDALRASLESNDCGDSDVSELAQNMLNNALDSYRENDWIEFWYPKNSSAFTSLSAVPGVEGDETEIDDETVDEDEAWPQGQTGVSMVQVPASQQRKQKHQMNKSSLRPLPEDDSDRERELREWTNRFRVNVLALTERTRALRLVESAYAFQSKHRRPTCQNCGQKDHLSSTKHSILGKCGHLICTSCLNTILVDNKCSVRDCRAAVARQYVISGSHFAMCRPVNSPTPAGGTKVDALIRLLKDEQSIPGQDQVILFLQSSDLEGIVETALALHEISYVSVGTSGRRGRRKVKAFANSHDKRVAILQLGTENAAGLNLQNANHVIFFAPFAAKNHYEYQSTITQSSGRVIRFGQKKEVHIWHLMTLNTLEVGVLQGHDGRILVKRGLSEKFELVGEDEVKMDDEKGFDVPVFNWK